MRITLALLAAAALSGCAGEPGEAGRPTPYLGDEPAPPGASLDQSAIAAAASEAFAAARQLDVPAIVAFYEAMMAGADGGCPSLRVDETATTKTHFWYGDCATAAGVTFSGYGSLTRYDGALTEGGATRDGAGGYMDAVITRPDGTRLDIGMSYLADWVERQGDTTTYLRLIQGTASASGPSAPESPWLRGERGGSITVQVTTHGGGAREIYVDGSLSGLAGSAHAAAFSGLYASFSPDGPRCADPMGTISLRQDGGGWYDVVFDAVDPHTYAVDTGACDGCGAGYFGGASIGPVCVDARPLGAFTGAPW